MTVGGGAGLSDVERFPVQVLQRDGADVGRDVDQPTRPGQARVAVRGKEGGQRLTALRRYRPALDGTLAAAVGRWRVGCRVPGRGRVRQRVPEEPAVGRAAVHDQAGVPLG